MKSPCDKLSVITTIFEDIRNSANQSQKEVNSLINLGSENVFSESSVLFKTWNCSKMRTVMGELCDGYGREYEVKRKVMENIAHSKAPEELTVHLCAWEFEMFVDSGFDLLVKQLALEAEIESEQKNT